MRTYIRLVICITITLKIKIYGILILAPFKIFVNKIFIFLPHVKKALS
jgi:hypothetical protein